MSETADAADAEEYDPDDWIFTERAMGRVGVAAAAISVAWMPPFFAFVAFAMGTMILLMHDVRHGAALMAGSVFAMILGLWIGAII